MTPDYTLEVFTAGFVYRGGTTERGNEQSEVQGRDEGVKWPTIASSTGKMYQVVTCTKHGLVTGVTNFLNQLQKYKKAIENIRFIG